MIRILSILIAALCCGGLVAAEHAPKEGKGKNAAEAGAPLAGTVVSCADGKLVCSIGKGKKAEQRTLTVDDKTTVTLPDGKAGTVADLKPSLAVELTVEGDRATAVKLVAAKEKKEKKEKKD